MEPTPAKLGLPHFFWRCHDFLYYRMPQSWRGAIDFYYYRPDLFRPFGGAFNGQRFRRLIFNELLTVFDFEAVVETGTYTGNTTAYIDEHVLCPIFSVELSPRFHAFSRRRLKSRENVTLKRVDSRKFLHEAALSSSMPKGTVLFYLDAHWNDDLPLAEELRVILDVWSNPVIMIDDFQVPGDEGYSYDDYGSGKVLNEAYLRDSGLLEHVRVFYPAASSDQETGFKRGCVVLTNRSEAAESITRVHSLRSV